MTLEVSDLIKSFCTKGECYPVLQNISFQVKSDEIVCIMGPSGCGKSTLLRLIAGLELPTSGSVTLNGEPVVAGVSPMGMIFQEYSLLPWCTVYDNTAIGCTIARLSDDETRKRVLYFLKLVGLEESADMMPFEISGGMQQRAAIARSLVVHPEILLMDEPFSALDSQNRQYIQESLLAIQHKTQKSIIMVTHNAEGAVFIADRILVLSRRPGVLSRTVEVNLPHPRRKDSDEFRKIVQSIITEIHDDVRLEQTGAPTDVT